MGVHAPFIPNFAWIIVLWCVVGFGIGGAASSFTLLSEFLPSNARAKILIVYPVGFFYKFNSFLYFTLRSGGLVDVVSR